MPQNIDQYRCIGTSQTIRTVTARTKPLRSERAFSIQTVFTLVMSRQLRSLHSKAVRATNCGPADFLQTGIMFVTESCFIVSAPVAAQHLSSGRSANNVCKLLSGHGCCKGKRLSREELVKLFPGLSGSEIDRLKETTPWLRYLEGFHLRSSPEQILGMHWDPGNGSKQNLQFLVTASHTITIRSREGYVLEEPSLFLPVFDAIPVPEIEIDFPEVDGLWDGILMD